MAADFLPAKSLLDEDDRTVAVTYIAEAGGELLGAVLIFF